MAKPDDWVGQKVVIGTDMYGDDTMGTLEEVSDRGVVVRHEIVEVESELVEIESERESEVLEIETESEAELQSIFYPWTKVNWMYHPEETSG
jgi:translation initiation factor 6 (eIF-6)